MTVAGIDIVSLVVTWLIMSLSFFIVSKLPIGVEIDSLNKVLVSAAVFGILNALVKPVFSVLALPFVILTLGLFTFVVNAAVFGLAAWLVEGFRLRWGFWSALLGSIALSIVNSILSNILT
ncbi:MAG: phage holin family protein [Cyanobacteria bacterium SID2]|nr:phage holin family protein [Cyanobacteria bacterium SID2]MBP0005913.1 phage holin family protein [Cyanobacteria bacterium SBC]